MENAWCYDDGFGDAEGGVNSAYGSDWPTAHLYFSPPRISSLRSLTRFPVGWKE